MNIRTFVTCLVTVSALALSGCSAFPHDKPSLSTPVASDSSSGSDLGQLVYLATQTMAERAGVLSKDLPIIVSTIVSIDDFNRSSTFGRLASQLVSNRLAQRGYLVTDVTYVGAITPLPGTGELVLSRDIARVKTILAEKSSSAAPAFSRSFSGACSGGGPSASD